MQLRYIDKNGLEKIRIDRDKIKKEPFIVPHNKLQDKANRYYFYDSKAKPLEQVWFSALDLNIEHGKVEIPYRPTLRAMYPINLNGEFGGILIINYLMKDFLNKFTNMPLYDTIIYNNEGYTIYHYQHKVDNHTKCWGNSLETKYNIKNEFPNEFDSIINNTVFKTDTLVSRKLDLPIYGGLNILIKLKKSYLQQQENDSNTQYITISTIQFIASLLLTFIIIKFFSNKLLNLEELSTLHKNIEESSKVANIGYWEYYPNGQLNWSSGVYDIFGINNKQMQMNYEKFLSYIPKEDKEKLINEINNSIAKKSKYFITHQIITENKKIKHVEERATHIYKNGEHIKSIGTILDITVLKNVENRLKDFLSASTDFAWEIDTNGLYTYASDGVEKILGYKAEEIIRKSPFDFMPKDQADELKESITETIKNKLPIKNLENKNITKGGKEVVLLTNGIPFYKYGEFVGYRGTDKDITKDKENEQQLKQKEIMLLEQSKLASMGEMIGNIAHQWRQPLSIITSSASGIQVKHEFNDLSDEDIQEFTTLIVEQADYLSATIDNFRNFLKEDKSFQNISVVDIINKSLSLTQASLNNNYTTIITQLEDDLTILGNKQELVQVFINMFNNSKDALKEKNIIEDDRFIFIDTKLLNDNELELIIKDSGGGFQEDIIHKIFEPYFTTKHESIGTGLGLAMSHQILVERHHATIQAYNEEYEYNGKRYKGACFQIIFKYKEFN